MKIDYDKLYYFTENFGLSGRAFRVDPTVSMQIEDVEAIARGEVRPKTAISFVQQGGTNICDVIWTGFPPLVLVSKLLRDVLETNGVTNWATYSVEVYDKEGKQIRGYAGLSFLGRADAVDFSRSKIVWRGPNYEGGPKWQNYVGLFFKNDSWDGTDFFMAEGRSSIFVTERVKEALKRLQLRNVEFERLSEYETEVPGSLTKLRLHE